MTSTLLAASPGVIIGASTVVFCVVVVVVCLCVAAAQHRYDENHRGKW